MPIVIRMDWIPGPAAAVSLYLCLTLVIKTLTRSLEMFMVDGN